MPSPIFSGPQVNLTPTSGAQDGVTTTTLVDGRAVIAWRDGLSTLRYEIMNPDGSISQAPHVLNQLTTGNIGAAFDAQVQLASLSNGGFVAVWNWRQTLDSIHYIVYDAAGNVVKGETEVTHPIYSGTNGNINAAMVEPTVIGAANGDFVIGFRDTENTTVTTVQKVYTQLITSASGYSPTATSPVQFTNVYNDYRPTIGYAGGASTNINLVFENSADWNGTIAQFPARSGLWGGLPGFNLYRVDLPNTAQNAAPYLDTNPDIAYSSDFGHFMVAWTANGVVKASIDGDGANTFIVSPTATNTTVPPKVVSVNGVGFLVLWSDGGSAAIGQSGYDVVGRLYSDTGAPLSADFVVTNGSVTNNSMQTVDATGLADGRILITWTASGPSSNGIDVYSQIVKAPKFVGSNFQLDGGPGLDTALFAGKLAQYSVVKGTSSISISDLIAGRDGSGSLTNVEQLKFSDITLVFDLQSQQDTLVYKLYQAAFARTPDNAGFRFWATLSDANNLSATSLANSFLAAPEFTQKYGANPTNTAYVTALYSNVLGRTPDQSGLNFWIGVANSGLPKDQLLISFATSAENAALVGSHISNGFWTT